MRNFFKKKTFKIGLIVFGGLYLIVGLIAVFGDHETMIASTSKPKKEPNYTYCKAAMEGPAIDIKRVMDEAGIDVTFSMNLQRVTVNRRHPVWRAIFDDQTFNHKQNLTRSLAIYNNCVNRKRNKGDVMDTDLIELRDAHTNEKFASIGVFNGFKVH